MTAEEEIKVYEEEIEQYKKKFIKGGEKTIFNKRRSLKKEEDIRAAVDCAYKDFSSRTLKRINKNVEINKESKEKALGDLSSCFFGLFNEGLQKSFDVWHKEICNEFKTKFNAALQGAYHDIEYGKAQKIVNMTFKYLYCFEEASEHREVFQQCHMPIDSFTLNWIKNGPNEKSKDGLPKAWSDMTDTQYDTIRSKVIDYLASGKQYTKSDGKRVDLPKKPFYAEFIIWAEEMKEAARNSVNKILDKYDEDEDFLNEIQIAVQKKIKNLPHD